MRNGKLLPIRPAILFWVCILVAVADTHEEKAQRVVEALVCGDSTVAARLNEESRIHSRRDLGWRFFSYGEEVDVERAFRISKSMEIRYRWKVTQGGQTQPVTEPARDLCK